MLFRSRESAVRDASPFRPGALSSRPSFAAPDSGTQLKIQKLHGLAWSDFEEGPIKFPPSYKFDIGTQEYDTRCVPLRPSRNAADEGGHSEKQRTPSWTDRILWLSVHEGTTRTLSYASHPEISLSDHKPVSALLSVQVCFTPALWSRE